VEEIHEERRIAINLTDDQILVTYFAWCQSLEKWQGACYQPLKDNTKHNRWDIERIKEADCRRSGTWCHEQKTKVNFILKRKDLNLLIISIIPLNKSNAIQAVASSLAVCRSMLHTRFQWGELNHHTSGLNLSCHLTRLRYWSSASRWSMRCIFHLHRQPNYTQKNYYLIF
jgi:hypothetical protein